MTNQEYAEAIEKIREYEKLSDEKRLLEHTINDAENGAHLGANVVDRGRIRIKNGTPPYTLILTALKMELETIIKEMEEI